MWIVNSQIENHWFISHLILSIAFLCSLGREGVSHCRAVTFPVGVKFDALRLAPFSSAVVYVTILVYPIALHALTLAPYSFEHALGVPSVQTLSISAVVPLSKARATGRPIMATPTSPCSL